MTNVAQLDDYRPHREGEARCEACGHRWVAVVPLGGSLLFECPACGTLKGRYVHRSEPADTTAVWNCNCGCTVFERHLLKSGAAGWMCINCGTWWSDP